MKKLLLGMMMIFLLVGCASQTNESQETPVETKTTVEAKETVETNEEAVEESTFTYESEKGPIDLPIDPERIVILNSFAAGAILKFDGSVVGHELWTGGNPLFADLLKDSTEVAADNLEQIMALNPDLIIASSNDENLEELEQIAPTVALTYGRLSYLDVIVEIGRIVNKEEEAKVWVEDFNKRAVEAGKKMKDQYGKDVSITVIEAFGDELYLYGDNWGRGTQVVYQAMGLTMTEAVKEVALKDGYYAISSEVIPDYAADLMIMSYFNGSNMAFTETDTWHNIPAVKNDKVLKTEAEAFYMTGPISLEHQLNEIERFFLK